MHSYFETLGFTKYLTSTNMPSCVCQPYIEQKHILLNEKNVGLLRAEKRKETREMCWSNARSSVTKQITV